MAKRKSKFNLGYFCSLKNIVPIILVAIIVFFVFNLLQNKSFNPLFEGMEVDVDKLNRMAGRLAQNMSTHEDEHEKIDPHDHPGGGFIINKHKENKEHDIYLDKNEEEKKKVIKRMSKGKAAKAMAVKADDD
mgnify:CR=1 FL=1|tara:strand:+ start:136 stop:531 length:396 start_codon:yes stop_codon:yes gene_type:complete